MPRAWGWLSLVGDLSLTVLLAVGWIRYFGRLGPRMDADVAVHSAMVLRPIDAHFIFFWGQPRLGSLVPLVGKMVHAAGVPAASAVFLSVVGIVGCALFVALRLCLTLAARMLLLAPFAWPSLRLAESLLSAGSPVPGMFLFSVSTLALLRRSLSHPRGRMAAPASVLGGFAAAASLWCGEPAAAVLLALGICRIAKLRAHWPSKPEVRAAGLWILGAAPMFSLILAGQIMGKDTADRSYWATLGPKAVVAHLRGAVHALHDIIPALPGTLVLFATLVSALLGGMALARAPKDDRHVPSPFTLMAFAPAAALLGTASSRWVALNQNAARYEVYPVVLLVLTVAYAVDLLLIQLHRNWVSLGTTLLALGFLVRAHRRDPPGNAVGLGPLAKWQDRISVASALGCESVLAPYWESYPFYALSDGHILASPREGDGARELSLAREAALARTVCIVPWWSDPGCPARLSQYEVHLNAASDLRARGFCVYRHD